VLRPEEPVPTNFEQVQARIHALNEAYHGLHQDMEEFLADFRAEYSREVNILNAQYLSTIGFAVTDVKTMQATVSAAILDRAMQIGSTQAECIVEADAHLTNLTFQYGLQLSALTQETYSFHSDVTLLVFKPILDRFNRNSNLQQHAMLAEISEENLSVLTKEELVGMEQRFEAARLQWETVEQTEINAYYLYFLGTTNQVKYQNFSNYLLFRDSYLRQAGVIKDSLVNCE
jgi:hypothetical protein